MKMCHSKACSSMSFHARTCPCNHHSGWKIEQFQPSLRLISALWFLFGIIKFCWFWNFAHGNGIQLYILFSIWLSSMLVHASAIVLFLCCVQFHCVNTLHIFLLCYWWIFGLLSSLWPFWIKLLWSSTCVLVYTFFLGNVPISRIALVDTAKQFWINYTSTCNVWEIQLFNIL